MDDIEYRACHKEDLWVQLTPAELNYSMSRGATMHRVSVAANRKNKYDEKLGHVTSTRIHEVGEIASKAIAKAVGLPYQCVINSFKRPDLKHLIECRLIGVDYYGLRVKEDDPENHRVVGAVCEKGHELDPIRIPGWIYARDAQQHKEWKKDPGHRDQWAYFVPQEHLRPISELLTIIHDERRLKLSMHV